MELVSEELEDGECSLKVCSGDKAVSSSLGEDRSTRSHQKAKRTWVGVVTLNHHILILGMDSFRL